MEIGFVIEKAKCVPFSLQKWSMTDCNYLSDLNLQSDEAPHRRCQANDPGVIHFATPRPRGAARSDTTLPG
jgi:hypothetical protein